jgi:hypothetical protein
VSDPPGANTPEPRENQPYPPPAAASVIPHVRANAAKNGSADSNGGVFTQSDGSATIGTVPDAVPPAVARAL